MALETATYIDGLVPANPLGSDAIAFADDHIRLIKSTLKATFPNITGPVTLKQDQINQAMPIGGVIMWSQGTIPSGWALCNGQTVARSDGAGNITTPNLTDRFVVAAGGSYGLNAAGGNAFITLSTAHLPAHNHPASTDGQGGHNHTASGSTDGVGDHQHGLPNNGSVQAGSDNGGANVAVSTGYSSGRFQAPTNGAGAHSHTFNVTTSTNGVHSHNVSVGNTGSGAAIDIRNPYYALYYIMKV
jgi:microcystin-dependent protein